MKSAKELIRILPGCFGRRNAFILALLANAPPSWDTNPVTYAEDVVKAANRILELTEGE